MRMRAAAGILLAFPLAASLALAGAVPRAGFVRVSDDRRGFVIEGTSTRFIPIGFNYDHDETGRLIEDYWAAEWPKVEADFREMKDLGATVVRVHLQASRFLDAKDRPNVASLERLKKLLKLCESLGLKLDLTGLGCYHKQDVPAWYDALDDRGRWEAQAAFWKAVARACAESPAVFCYDLMNEPVVSGTDRRPGDWLAGAFAGKHFVQFINLHRPTATRPEVAAAWLKFLADAVREVDPHHLITVGMVDWSLDRPGLTSGFDPKKVAEPLDFICIHLYPEAKKVADAIATLDGFQVGKPVVIEETFPLKAPMADFRQFLDQARPRSAGLIGFYWGKTPDELKAGTTISDAITLEWLKVFGEESRRQSNRQDAKDVEGSRDGPQRRKDREVK